MQRFTLFHDGSNQGWQVVYLAYHVAARLGASLLVLLVDPTIDNEMIAQRAAQVEVGGRAAGLAIRSRLITDFTVEMVAKHASGSAGLFVPGRLIQVEKSADQLLEALSCPLWIVSEDSEIHKMALLVNDVVAEKGLIDYTTSLSNRLQEPLIGLVQEDKLATARAYDVTLPWWPLPDFSSDQIDALLNQLGYNILFLPISEINLVFDLSINCVVYPA
ncbi:MAG: hypothetical protein WAM60_23160 [Candidatus Promineifilaceae bacterium]